MYIIADREFIGWRVQKAVEMLDSWLTRSIAMAVLTAWPRDDLAPQINRMHYLSREKPSRQRSQQSAAIRLIPFIGK